ncbi:hypothetical protein LguiB_019120 [Lonicera macranthoides]
MMYKFDCLISNEIYEAAELYMTPKSLLSANTLCLKVIRFKKKKNIMVTLSGLNFMNGTEATPAEVAELLLNNEDDVTLNGLADFLHVKMKENKEANVKKARVEY